ncbi:hypothetical protein WJX75_007071 [Coccomyxa subellipsoidea]|uniref:Malectin domain-containing protein n=1 Tax=Coccomyxa subellipsoidea TaxID=248742 RepID=A0ABR2YDE6_9CHLO
MRKKRGCVLIFLLALSNQVLLGTGLAPVDLYIDAGNTSSDFTDTEGHTWLPDQSFTGGGTEGFHDPISNAPYGTAAIYQTNRLGGSFEYAFGPADGLAAGHNYTVTLLFCELYFDRPSQRLFSGPPPQATPPRGSPSRQRRHHCHAPRQCRPVQKRTLRNRY